jgi:DNA phosphorothioation-dependent restriction protein DptG
VIKLLSPGIDLEEERVVEVSAVAFPAIKGPALFTASRHAYFALSYAEVKERKALMGEKRSKVKDNIDTLFQVISDIESTDPNELIGVDPKALKLNAIQGFYDDLLEVFDLDEDEVEQTPQVKPDNIGAYEDIPQPYQEYAESDTSDRAEFAQPLKKRRRR